MTSSPPLRPSPERSRPSQTPSTASRPEIQLGLPSWLNPLTLSAAISVTCATGKTALSLHDHRETCPDCAALYAQKVEEDFASLDPDWVDLALIKGWLQRCIESCTMCKPVAPLSQRPRWLIDVRRHCLVAGHAAQRRYLALSYVWGDTTSLEARRDNIDALQKPGTLQSPSMLDQIPPTIRDAITFTAMLDEQYLWVDRLCICQDDDDQTKTDEIHAMGSIYANAYVTIVNVAGDNARHGLRGLPGLSGPRVINRQNDLSEKERNSRTMDLLGKECTWVSGYRGSSRGPVDIGPEFCRVT
jgi:hypothetical protein